jgi:hypothetical protein
MAVCGELIDDVVKAAVVPPVRAAGFKGTRRSWQRVSREAVAVVNVQASSYNSGATGRFTLNLGVEYPVIRKILDGAAIEKPKEYECILRARVGMLAERRDVWWDVHPGFDQQGVVQRVHRALAEHALPWFERLETLEAGYEELRRRLDRRASVAAAVALGKWSEAERMVDEASADLSDKNPAFVQFLTAWWKTVARPSR